LTVGVHAFPALRWQVFTRIGAIEKQAGGGVPTLLRTHPMSDARVTAIEAHESEVRCCSDLGTRVHVQIHWLSLLTAGWVTRRLQLPCATLCAMQPAPRLRQQSPEGLNLCSISQNHKLYVQRLPACSAGAALVGEVGVRRPAIEVLQHVLGSAEGLADV
jgi:hypothetical protein